MNFVVSKQVHLGQGRHGQFLADKAATSAPLQLSILQNQGKA